MAGLENPITFPRLQWTISQEDEEEEQHQHFFNTPSNLKKK
jgi:hypothetical protein